jgi:hypothetical protein
MKGKKKTTLGDTLLAVKEKRFFQRMQALKTVQLSYIIGADDNLPSRIEHKSLSGCNT